NSTSFDFLDSDSLNLTKIYKELVESRDRRINFVRMLCFSQDLFLSIEDLKDEKKQSFADNLLFKGWARSRMWAQYAENHAGVCLVFDKNKLISIFENQIYKKNISNIQHKPIEYSNNLVKFEETMSDISEIQDTQSDYKNFFLGESQLELLFQKCEDFRDENEYRFCLLNNTLQSPDDEMYIDYADSLKAIILGARFPELAKIYVPDTIKQFRISWEYGKPVL
nr:DUF2971 domain-containing protein [Treponema sp.]